MRRCDHVPLWVCCVYFFRVCSTSAASLDPSTSRDNEGVSVTQPVRPVRESVTRERVECFKSVEELAQGSLYPRHVKRHVNLTAALHKRLIKCRVRLPLLGTALTSSVCAIVVMRGATKSFLEVSEGSTMLGCDRGIWTCNCGSQTHCTPDASTPGYQWILAKSVSKRPPAPLSTFAIDKGFRNRQIEQKA